MLLSACLASCDPQSYQYEVVRRVVVLDNIPYVLAMERSSFGINMSADEIPHTFMRQEPGGNWQEVASPPEQVSQTFLQANGLPRSICRSNEPNTCYRITGQDQVEFTQDGGKRWQVVWKMPAGRLAYMQDYIENRSHLLHVNPDSIPYDLGMVENDDGYELIVAMGNQGILVRNPGGSWERQAVGSARPVPFHAQSFQDITATLGLETFCAISIAIFLLFCLTIVKLIVHRKRVPLVIPFLLFPAIWLPFVLWAMGVVMIYNLSVALAVLLSLGICLFSMRRKKAASSRP